MRKYLHPVPLLSGDLLSERYVLLHELSSRGDAIRIKVTLLEAK